MMQKPLVLTTLATVSLFAIPAQAVTIQFNTTSIFNADVVVNNAGGTINSAGRTPLDSSTSNQTLITNSAAAQLSPTSGNGLPDNGFFAANSFHPDVQLSFSNSTSRPNARRAFSSTSFNFPVTAGNYDRVDVFAISTQGSSNFSITFNYSDLSSTTTASVSAPDWFNEITETTSRYYLVNNLDRFNLNNNTLDNVNDPAIFGFSFTPDSARTLSSITVNPTSQFFTFFGSTGNQIPTQTATPEPASTLAILGLGLGTLVAKARKLG